MKAYVSRFDLRLFRAIFNYRRDSFLPAFFRVISFIGGGYFYFLFAIYMYFAQPELFKPTMFVSLIGFGIHLPIYFILKNMIRRVRPFNAHNDIDNMVYPIDEFSFPSGHTAAAFLVAFIISHFIPALAVYMYIYASLVGLSRIYVGVHYPSDIIAGAAFGTGVGWGAVYIVNHFIY